MDITMCCANKCTRANKCFRYRKDTNDNQDYYDFEYECNVGGKFDYYISMLETEVKERICEDGN